MSASRGNGKITRKEMSNLFSCDCDHYDKVKCCQNMKFEETKDGNRLILMDYCEEYLGSIIMSVLRKTNSHSVDICRLIKNK